ncbi:PhzF family phenazine biosynthesis protein [Pontibacter diazotrophicus]|uniref:PhzF family phenazine biosynthesis protein n=1 Tax=Pontibacter diazotrophicus TaxID=1400979 RepID=A0A3D8LHP2_9BACT|nr:PhzF family phenazine biosynthesis protein [Pontibacter diazotrophicus]RDV16856.1 PhzF family phenazine biosynthesis protein [Pontibacter diazotrophicus]
MPFPLYQIDSFTDKLFGGNPAAVCLLQHWLPDPVLLQIAAENFLPETAFIIPSTKAEHYHIRWFTPEIEMDLCGHATLAAAHVVFKHVGLASDKVIFSSASGELTVTRQGSLLTLDFPSRMPVTAELPEIILKGMGRKPLEVLKARDYVLVYDSEDTVRALQPNRAILDKINLDPGGIIITAKGETSDFVSRFFTPQASIFEDPVTGSAHCSLIPYWSQRLRRKELTALQVSARTGKLYCTDKGDRVLIGGTCVTYLQGTIYI